MISTALNLVCTQTQSARPSAALEATNRPVGDDTRLGIPQLFKDVVDGQGKMASVMKSALSGHPLTSVEMLAVQAGIYRYAIELDLATKVVEKLSNGVRQTMNTQVG